MTLEQTESARALAFDMLAKAAIPLREEEKDEIETTDFGLGDFARQGACIATLVATERYAVKAIALQPGQTLPEHWHPPIGDDPGKQETIRVAWGECLLFLDGVPSIEAARIPAGKEEVYTCRREVVLARGDQRILAPGQKHWFQGGTLGAVVYSFSSMVRDLHDGFTDPLVVRMRVTGDEASK